MSPSKSNKLRRKLWTVICSVLLISGTDILPLNSFYLGIIVTVLAVLTLLIPKNEHFEARTKQYSVSSIFVVFALLSLVILSAANSPYFLDSIEVSRVAYSGSLIIAITVLSMFETSDLIRKTFLDSVVLLSFLGLLCLLAGYYDSSVPSSLTLDVLPFRYFGVFTTPSVNAWVSLCALVIAKYTSGLKWMHLVLLLNLVLSQDRTSLLIFVFLILFVAIEGYLKVAKQRGRLVTIRLILILLLSVSMVFIVSYLFKPRINQSNIFTGREYIWSYCNDLIKSAGVTGYGPNFTELNKGETSLVNFNFATCHNQMLDNVVNYGWIFAVIFLFMTLTTLNRLARIRDVSGLLLVCLISTIGLVATPIQIFTQISNAWGALLFFNLVASNYSRKAATSVL